MTNNHFRIYRVEVEDDTIELDSHDDAELRELLDDDLRDLLDELVVELRQVRAAKESLFDETLRLRESLATVRIENRDLRFRAAFPELGRNQG